MERLGMRREGHSYQSMLLHGVWQDVYHYALLQEEWLVLQESAHESSKKNYSPVIRVVAT